MLPEFYFPHIYRAKKRSTCALRFSNSFQAKSILERLVIFLLFARANKILLLQNTDSFI